MTEEPSKLDISDEMIAERRGGSEKMPDDMPSWMASTITKIDKFSKQVGSSLLDINAFNICNDLLSSC